MACEFVANATQTVALNAPVVFNTSIPCRKNCVYHENETGIIILRGITNQDFATYRVTYNGNIALPDGATVVPIAVSLVVGGEIRPTSTAIFTPAAAEEYGNVTSTAIIKVPRGCCFSLAVENIPADPAETPAANITVQNSNLVVDRIA